MKQGFIGSYDLGFLDGLSKAIRETEGVVDERVSDLEDIFYASAFQSGLERFLVHPHDVKSFTKSEFVKARVASISESQHAKHATLVCRAFAQDLPRGYRDDPKYRPVLRLQFFLMDLMTAMECKSSLLVAEDIPDVADLQPILPPQVLVPVSNLLASVRYEVAAVPGTQAIVDHEHVRRYQEILDSGLFAKYSHAHEHLEDANEMLPKSVANVVSTGRSLLVTSRGVLASRNLAIAFLTITPQVIEAAFGRLPGALSETAARLGLGVLNERRRVVVYPYESFLLAVVRASLAAKLSADLSKAAPFLDHLEEGDDVVP